MTNNNGIVILKLGGSVITNKNSPFSVREHFIDQIIEQIIVSKIKIILIHGGGSFGHPLAKKFDVTHGFSSKIKNQQLGLAKTHNAMVKLNLIITNKFLERNFPVISLSPSSMFIYSPKLQFTGIKQIEILLDLNIMPILYGDIILKSEIDKFSIISGDQIALEICKSLRNYSISRVIFSIEEDGILGNVGVTNETSPKLIEKISINDLNSLSLAKLEQKIDVTGGIQGKLKEISNICELGIPVQLINGLKKDFIFKALRNQSIKSTWIS